MKRYHNDRRELALQLLNNGRYDDLEVLLQDSVLGPRIWHDQMIEFFKNHGLGRMWTEEESG